MSVNMNKANMRNVTELSDNGKNEHDDGMMVDAESNWDNEIQNSAIQPIQTTNVQTKSIIEFEPSEVRNQDTGSIKLIDNMTLLKILIVRGKDEHNPALWAGAQRLLKQLNCETDNQRSMYRGERGNQFYGTRGRGSAQQRGGRYQQGYQTSSNNDCYQNGNSYRGNHEPPQQTNENSCETYGYKNHSRRGGFTRKDNFDTKM